ncbi:MAG TPA: glycosyltransferase family 87 protein [Gemmatimonadales bacterium]|jgi:hypothetical protein
MLYVAATAIVILQRFEPDRHGIYLIFRGAFHDLVARRNLYATRQGLDYFRYSPAFALFFGPMAIGPFQIGVTLWAVINTVALYWILGRLLPPRQALLVRFLVLGDLVRSNQNGQSNALVAAFIVAAFIAYEHKDTWRGAWAVAGGAAIKLFPVGAALFALIRPFRWRAMATVAIAAIVLIVVPVVVTGPHVLLQEYRSWFGLEGAQVYKRMYSVMDLIDAWTDYYWPRWPIQLAGLVLLLVPVVLRRDSWELPGWRLRLLCSVLVFCVLFNHGAESPSYVIAMTGIAIWWTATPRSRAHNIMLILTLLFSTVARSSLVPVAFRVAILDPARVMVMPLLASWLLLQYELLRGERSLVREAGEPDILAAQAAA